MADDISQDLLTPNEDKTVELLKEISSEEVITKTYSEHRINEAIRNLQNQLSEIQAKLDIWLARKAEIDAIPSVTKKVSELEDTDKVFRYLDGTAISLDDSTSIIKIAAEITSESDVRIKI